MTTYLTDSEGKFIPATQRPDGTWRKARRVKEGYVPQEEVPLYESKGKQFANRKSNLPVGMCPLVAAAEKKEREKQQRSKNKQQNQTNGKSVPGVIVLPKNTLTNNATTASTAKTTAKVTNTAIATVLTSGNSNFSTNTNSTTPQTGVTTVDVVTKDLGALQLPNDDDLAKKLKKLRKKIREIETIEAKIKCGELKKPENDQMEKVKRKKEILKEIKILEEQTEAD